MSSRSKKFISILCCLLLLTVAGTAGGVLLSPALPSLEKQITLQKCGVIGTNIRFSTDDFDDVLHAKSEFIRVDTLPAMTQGTLLLGITPVSENQLIARTDYNKLAFVPADLSVDFADFTFSNATAKQTDVTVSCTMNLLDEINLAPSVGAQTLPPAKASPLLNFSKPPTRKTTKCALRSCPTRRMALSAFPMTATAISAIRRKTAMSARIRSNTPPPIAMAIRAHRLR